MPSVIDPITQLPNYLMPQLLNDLMPAFALYIKAVAISTPAATHYEMVKQSLLAGKDVFVAKCQE